MPLFCTERPNRTKSRPFTFRKAAKIVCRLFRDGGSRAEWERTLDTECPPLLRDRPAEEERALEIAAQALEQNNVLLDADALMLERFLGVFSLIALVFRRIGAFAGAPGRLVTAGVIAAEAAARQRLATITVQKAANDAALTTVRRAAANEARFAIRSGTR